MAACIALIGSVPPAYAKECNHAHGFRYAKHRFHLVFKEAFHGRSVIAKNLRHPHHCSKGDHDVTIDPHGVIRRDPHRIPSRCPEDTGDRLFHFVILVSAEAVFARFSEHVLQVFAASSIQITAAINDRPRLLDLLLTHSGLAQAFFLVGGADHDEAPRLKIVPAGRFHAGVQNRRENLVRHGDPSKLGVARRSPIASLIGRSLPLSVMLHPLVRHRSLRTSQRVRCE